MRTLSIFRFGSRRVGACLAVVWLIGVTAPLSARVGDGQTAVAQPSSSDRNVAIMVSTLLREEHLSRQPLDDEKSERALKRFLKDLDPMKVYFLQSDIDEFQTHVRKLDDQLRKGDISFGYKVFQRFLQRVDQRVEAAKELLDQPHDFTAKESIAIDADKLAYPASDAEAKERWRQRVKYDLLLLKTQESEKLTVGLRPGDVPPATTDNGRPNPLPPVEFDAEEPAIREAPASPEAKIQQARDKLKRRYSSIQRRWHQFDAEELLETFLTAMTSSFDPHTTYMAVSTLDDFNISMSLQLEGIGAALEPDDGYTKVTKIIAGGAADKAGQLKPEDRIVSVGQGTSGPLVDVVDMKLRDVVKLIRGPAGTLVRLGVIPSGKSEMQICDITRARIELKDSEARSTIIQQGSKPDGTPYKIGVIDLPSFYMDMGAQHAGLDDYKSTTRDVRNILRTFTAQGVDAVVLNLRQNGGGSLTEAIDLTGLFIDAGPVVQVKNSLGKVRPHDDRDAGMAWSGPLVVMTSKFSASASEILAGAIQDYSRGLIVGDTSTHGKGTVQSLLDLGAQLFPGITQQPKLGALKITIQQFYRPSGESTQKRGVIPDVVLPALTSHFDVSEADLPNAIEFDTVKRAEFNRYNMVTEPIISDIRQRSDGRRAESADFAELNRDIDRYRTQKDRGTVTLNEEEFLAERKELNADKEEEKELRKQIDNDREVFELDYYNQEVINLTIDYLQLLGNTKVAQVR